MTATSLGLSGPAQECRSASSGAVGYWQGIRGLWLAGADSILKGWEGWVVKGGERVSGPAGVLLSWRVPRPPSMPPVCSLLCCLGALTCQEACHPQKPTLKFSCPHFPASVD